MNKSLPLIAGLVILLFSCAKDEVVNPVDSELSRAIQRASKTGNLDYYLFPQSDDFTSIPNQDPNNPITQEKVALGKFLFHETGLASEAAHGACIETYSCSSCHISSAGFTPGRIQGIADGGSGHGPNRQVWEEVYGENEIDAQGLRPLSILNVAYVTNTLWSGIFGANGVNIGTEDSWHGDPLSEVNFLGLEGLESQNIEGLDLHRLAITEKVLDEYGYRALFDEAFPDFPVEERYTLTAASFALGAYLRTILANEAPFQDWLRGDYGALSENEKLGAVLFFGKARCYTCHTGPSFSAMEFHVLGTSDLYHNSEARNTSSKDPRNLGRGFFTGNTVDNYKFKVPQLYNVKDYASYFHGSSKSTVRGVVEFKIEAESENINITNEMLSSRFRPVELSDQEIRNLVVFLENGLRDPNLERYVPESIPSGNCFPNNDPVSVEESGCK